jgi:ribose transport system ATP-binding protein
VVTAPTEESLALDNVSMTFENITVLHDVSMRIRRGEIHALLGQNGSGKSTLIKILSGFYTPDAGARINVMGDELSAIKSGEAARHGIAFVHQDLGLVGSMSVADNLAIGKYVTKRGMRIDWRAERANCARLLAEFGLSIDVRRPVESIGNPAERALIAVARAVASVREQSGEGLLVLDEPTAYLPHGEVVKLQEAVRSLAAAGIAVMYVTHKLDELPGFADNATILRDGHVVATVEMADKRPDDLVRLIIGHDLERASAEAPLVASPHVSPEPVLEVEGLCGGEVRDVGFSVGRGEIVGLTGLVGMGQEEVASLVFGAVRATAGRVCIDGAPVERPTPRSSIDAGVVFVPANRAVRGVSLSQSVSENVTLPALGRYFRQGRLRRRAELSSVATQLVEYQVKPPNPLHLIGKLSGGNQQKAVLAKWLQLQPRLVLVDEPTQGIDVGAREDVLQRLRDLASEGTAVLVASSEHEDLVALCQRVLVFRDGRVVAELQGVALNMESLLLHSSYGAEPVAASVGT